MQPVDVTTLIAVSQELTKKWLPARLELVYQLDRHTLALGLRTLDQKGWLTISWHPQAARIHLGSPPPRQPDTFTFSQQLQHQLTGLALIQLVAIDPWERVLDLQFARRPGDDPLWHLYLEIMGKYSNVVLVNHAGEIVTAAHQVSSQQSRLRPIQTGQPYQAPPPLTTAIPTLTESFQQWQNRLSLVPGAIDKLLLTCYRGLSSALVRQLLDQAQCPANLNTDHLSSDQWQRLFAAWQAWLNILESGAWSPGWREVGYSVLGWGLREKTASISELLATYYGEYLQLQAWQHLRQHLQQKLQHLLGKLQEKARDFQTRLGTAAQAQTYLHQANLLNTYRHQWQPGLTTLTVTDFETNQPLTIPLDPERHISDNVESLYKRYKKLKRAEESIQPLLQSTEQEIAYLAQVAAAVAQCDSYRDTTDLETLEEIRDELIEQKYLSPPDYRRSVKPGLDFLRFTTPSGWDVLIGRNNRQNDHLTFRLASPYDLWFHTQEIPGSHVLLRLEAGMQPSDKDLQYVANLAAYYSQARHTSQVPVVYTDPKHVYKPKGMPPGLVIYKQETILWAYPSHVIFTH
ncbi:NFACT RNA binding domain-containing protein [Thermosynechococcaceae cyanobacterium BACA0444]|uniref:Rqc2 homolog RqcH n=1 Tax=Pseudocalidococcus azoricus BACA0444 TaxID=2918990 RepID=A0AAE4FPY0_9CYAN|nr:NFACT RNA binding domain-containing protein [Pseudocalidococcus azoricus]MDS3859357.1 NFACT RNA binding domain-containing protein [Pseudocalidococcus azoricus BACA0444]